jgi:hypothetical protein
VATARKWDRRENGSNRREPLPWVATSCPRTLMVRRGSPVRVRKRALAKGLQTRDVPSAALLHFAQRAQVWNRFWNSQAKTASVLFLLGGIRAPRKAPFTPRAGIGANFKPSGELESNGLHGLRFRRQRASTSYMTTTARTA